jgi:hypothetical protein
MTHPLDDGLPDGLRNALGRLAFFSQVMERGALNLVAIRFEDDSEMESKARVVLEGLTLTRVLDKVIIPLYEHDFGTGDQRLPVLAAAVKRARAAHDSRNQYLHAGWFGLGSPRSKDIEGVVYRAKKASTVKDAGVLTTVAVADIDGAADECAAAAADLSQALASFRSAP